MLIGVLTEVFWGRQACRCKGQWLCMCRKDGSTRQETVKPTFLSWRGSVCIHRCKGQCVCAGKTAVPGRRLLNPLSCPGEVVYVYTGVKDNDCVCAGKTAVPGRRRFRPLSWPTGLHPWTQHWDGDTSQGSQQVRGQQRPPHPRLLHQGGAGVCVAEWFELLRQLFQQFSGCRWLQSGGVQYHCQVS